MIDDLLTVRQLQDLLKVDRTTVYHMLRERSLPGFKVGGQWRFARAEIDTWLTAQQSARPSVAATETRGGTQAALPILASLSSETLPLHCIQPIQSVFAEALDVASVTTTLDGDPLTSFSNLGPFCSLIQSTGEGRRRCQASWQEAGRQTGGQPTLARCHAGLNYARGRVEVGDEVVAMVFAGQFRLDGEHMEPERLRLLAQACGLEPAALQAAAAVLPELAAAQAAKVLRLLQEVAETFSQIGQERLALMQRLRRISEMSTL